MGHMRKILPIVAAFALLLGPVSFGAPALADDGQGQSLASDHLIVQFEPGTSWSEMVRVHQQVGGKVEATIPELGVQVVSVPHSQKFFKSWAYRFDSKVRRVEPDYIAHVVDAPNDPYFDDYNQWGMFKVQAPEAWDITHGSPDICIAILDTGIDIDHPDLAGKIVANINFSNSATADANGNSHGTHVAGIAAAITNNGIGVAGLGYDCSLMNVKVMGDDGRGYYSWIAQGIIWATDNGADVINSAWAAVVVHQP